MVRGHSLRPSGTLQRIYCGITSNFQTTTTEFVLVALLAVNRIRRIRKIITAIKMSVKAKYFYVIYIWDRRGI